MKHFTALADLPGAHILRLLDQADLFFQQSPHSISPILKGKVVANVFFEPSTRTRISFEMAAKRLGAEVINFDHSNSSVKKGETLYDTLRTLESIGADALILRHSDDRVFDTLLPKFNVPLINAGAGKQEHPTQCLLDLFTLKAEFKKLDGLKLAICGDIKHSRVAGSMMLVAKRLGISVFLCGPSELIPETLPEGCVRGEIDDLIKTVDAFMCLRCQFERHDDLNLSTNDFHRDYGLTLERASRMQKHAIIMHPAPINRGVEIDDELVEDPRSRIFQQMKYGVFARMSILQEVLLGRN